MILKGIKTFVDDQFSKTTDLLNYVLLNLKVDQDILAVRPDLQNYFVFISSMLILKST